MDQALCRFAALLTKQPGSINEAQVADLRGHELSDRAIHDAVQVISYFNYINRVADGLGVDPEADLAV